jgi:hypothetical protein
LRGGENRFEGRHTITGVKEGESRKKGGERNGGRKEGVRDGWREGGKR